MDNTQEKVLDILEKITGTDEVGKNLDMDLFDEFILDSLGLVQLVVELSQAFSIEIAPAEVERDQWSSARKIVQNVEKKFSAHA
ncbi:MAG TPA: D-alanine--poly(phosphoribitol) ligase subunit DltC [Patescibacteria group bacterium]